MNPFIRLPLIAALAATAAPVLAADSALAYNIGAISDYRYRGISQTRLKPALQGGLDYSAAAGWYLGAWASTIRWIKDNGVDGPVEVDLYGGYKAEFRRGLSYDVGVLEYAYVGNKLGNTGGGGVYKNANTTEVYGALTVGPITGKVSYALTNLFGNYDFAGGRRTNGSVYPELGGSFDLRSGFTLLSHVGYQKVTHIAHASYTDYSATISKDVGHGIALSAGVVGTNADKAFYVPGAAANSSKYLGKTALVVGVKATF